MYVIPRSFTAIIMKSIELFSHIYKIFQYKYSIIAFNTLTHKNKKHFSIGRLSYGEFYSQVCKLPNLE